MFSQAWWCQPKDAAQSTRLKARQNPSIESQRLGLRLTSAIYENAYQLTD